MSDAPMIGFVHLYKAAGTTFTGILRRNFGPQHFDTRLLGQETPLTAAMLARAMWVYPRIKSIAGHHLRPFTDLQDGFPNLAFCLFVREPAARIVSAFQFHSVHRIWREGWKPQSDSDLQAAFDSAVARHRLGTCEALSRDGVLDEALATLDRRIGFVGTVEAFDGGLATFQGWARAQGLAVDVRYRRSNVSVGRERADPRLAPFQGDIARLNAFAAAIKASPAAMDRIRAACDDDVRLYEAAVAKFERLQQQWPAKRTALEVDDVGEDTAIGRAYRNIVGRPLVPLLTRSAA